jgi:hypothetical protein
VQVLKAHPALLVLKVLLAPLVLKARKAHQARKAPQALKALLDLPVQRLKQPKLNWLAETAIMTRL